MSLSQITSELEARLRARFPDEAWGLEFAITVQKVDPYTWAVRDMGILMDYYESSDAAHEARQSQIMFELMRCEADYNHYQEKP